VDPVLPIAEQGVRPFKILLVGLNYAPDFIGIPKYTTEFCEELVRRGHDVEVVTAPPYYPAWRVPKDYRGAWRSETLNGVRITRCPIFVPADPTGLTRLLHLLSFSISAFPAALIAAVTRRPDLVVGIAPSLLSAPVALVAAWLSGARAWLHIQDFEVDAAFELGMLKGEGARNGALGVERFLLKAFDRVSTISDSMRRMLVRKGVREDAAIEMRNWVDVDAVTMRPSSQTLYRTELNIPSDHTVVLYSGNMAGKQGLEVLADLAARLEAERAKVTVILCGQGPLRAVLEAACIERCNVRFLDLQPSERLPELLATADIHLLPQRAEAADLVLPSKLTGMLASGRPVVAMADEGTGLAAEVEGCGLIVPPGDAEAMTAAVIRLTQDDVLRHELALAARARAELRWRMSAVIDGFEAEVGCLLSGAVTSAVQPQACEAGELR
jgi:colanic acid biosynthesis glycosyl transferase WcaI